MRPASRRALVSQLSALAPQRRAPVWPVLAVVAVAAIVFLRLFAGSEGAVSVEPAESPGAPLLDPVLALPFGEGGANVSVPAAVDNGRIEALRTAYQRADDRQVLYQQLRERPEADARYLAFRAARDCELLRAGGVFGELETGSGRSSERVRQMEASTARCRGFLSAPAAPDELQRLQREAADAGHPAAQIALATESFPQHSLVETLNVLRRGLASGDPFAFDEGRVLLAMTRHQVEIAGVAPTTSADVRTIDARVVALDLVGCRLGNPCGPSRGMVAIECDGTARCQRDAEEWLLHAADLDVEEQRLALALADRMVAAFKRGAIDEIVRVPARASAQQ